MRNSRSTRLTLNGLRSTCVPWLLTLLVLLARVCQEEFPNAAAHIRLQLPAVDAVQKYLAEAVPLPPGALDAMGDALTVKEVEDWLAAIDKPAEG
ncbi:hypothetical protein RAMLITH_17465 [Ramlibacter sp. RBP-2]|uniref:Uncharacterized protein n=2 Tax=Ramlibacter lithotrophicus TaxID=2606681 RepID=A0A7X6I7V3_9BURK|nr:hypothetical protein [Ramlibacter lithotrophicus]